MSERIGDTPTSATSSALPWIALGAIAVVSAIVAWWWFSQSSEPAESEAITVADTPAPTSQPPLQSIERTPPEQPPAPDIPQNQPESALQTEPQETLPTLDESDPVIKAYFEPLSNDVDYQLLWQANQLLQRWVTVIDGASKGHLVRGVVPLRPPKKAFPVVKKGTQYYLDETGYRRFDTLVNAITSLDENKLVAGFHKFRPLLEEAYGQLGFDANELDNTLVRMLDRVINASTIEGPIELKASSVNYTFADESLEKLTALEKLLIRMGPENSRKLKTSASSLKSQLLE